MISPANFPTSTASSTIQTAWQKRSGRDPQVFIPLFISLILAEVGSHETAQSTSAVKLKLWSGPNGTVGREEYIGGHPLWADSAAKSGEGRRLEAAANAGVDVPCSTMASYEILQ